MHIYLDMSSNLKKFSNHELVLRMEKLARTERKITHLVLQNINELEQRKIYADMGYENMFSYLTRHFGYSESSAYRRLQSARLLLQIPEVSQKLENGSLNLSQLTQMQRCITSTGMNSADHSREVIAKIADRNSFETNQILAKEFNLPIQSADAVKPQKDESVRLEITFSKEQFEILKIAKSNLSHSCPSGNWAELITKLALRNLSKEKRLLLSARIKKTAKEKLTHSLSVETESGKPSTKIKIKKRKFISIHIRRNLFKKANNCCEYVHPHTKIRCGSKYQLQVDHIKPISLGGTDEIDNLRILCRTHNIREAEKLGLSRFSGEMLN